MQKEQYIKIDEYGDKYYFSDKYMSVLHREGGPAIEWSYGGGLWYRNGKLHREDGPAIETKSGYNVWYQDGAIHREDGPAIEYFDGGKSWYYKGVRHRVGGPAVEFADVDGRPPQWWVNGEQVTSVSETFLQLKKIIELSLRSVRQIDRLPTSETATVLPAVRIDILETVTHAEKLLSKLMGGKSGLEQ